jgi:hypothetical protein
MAGDPEFAPGRPLVPRNGTVLALDDADHVLTGADVLIRGGLIAATGPRPEIPGGTVEALATPHSARRPARPGTGQHWPRAGRTGPVTGEPPRPASR